MKGEKRNMEQNVESLVGMPGRVAEINEANVRNKRDEEQLKLLASVLEQSTEGMAFCDLEGNLVSVNSTLATMHKYTRRELVGRNISVLHKPEQIPILEDIYRQTREEGTSCGELWHLRADGTCFLGQFHSSIILDDEGKPIGMVRTVRDITSTREAEKALRESEERMSTIVNTVIDGLYISSLDGHIMIANDAAARIVGYESKEEIIGINAMDFLAPCHRESVATEVVQAWREGKNVENRECRYVKADGTEIDGEFTCVHIRNEGGKTTGWVVASRDITQRKKAEEQLQAANTELREAHEQLKANQAQLLQTEKMSAVGTMVAGVAHELNNPLTGILHFARYCLKYTDETDRRFPVLQDTVRETKRCIDIIQNLLTFSNAGTQIEPEAEDCSLILDQVMRLLNYRVEKESITLKRNIPETIPPVRVRANEVQQVFLNLITNAMDAVKTTECKEISIEIAPAGEFVQISIADTGIGIPPDKMSKVFDYFFTTKEVGEGTGLGLSVTRNIVVSHGGEITCESEPGEGTRFTFTLPSIE